MSTLLVHNAGMLVTMDAQRREIRGGSVFIRDNVIEVLPLLLERHNALARLLADAAHRTN